jgi:HK97 gp10 family phage protein
MTSPFMTIKITGIKAVRDALDGLPGNMTVAISRKALKESADIVREEILARVPVDSGALRDSIKVRRARGNPNQAQVTAGSAEAWYAHLVEYGFNHTGHGPKRKRKRTSRGFVEGKSFMRGATEEKFEQVVDTFESTVVEQVAKAVDKANHQGAAEK